MHKKNIRLAIEHKNFVFFFSKQTLLDLEHES